MVLFVDRLTWPNTEPHDGELTTLRFRRQFTLVHENKYYSVLEQGGYLQAEAGPITSVQLLPRLHRRPRRQQSRQISAVAIQSSQQSASQPISTVSKGANGFWNCFLGRWLT